MSSLMALPKPTIAIRLAQRFNIPSSANHADIWKFISGIERDKTLTKFVSSSVPWAKKVPVRRKSCRTVQKH